MVRISSVMMLGFSWSLPNQSGTQALLVRIFSQTVEPCGSVDQEFSEIFLDVPTKRAEMALLVRTSFSPPRPNQAGRNGAVGRGFGVAGFSRLLPNQSGQQALLVGSSSQPGWPSGFVGQESSDVFLVVPTKRAAMALLVGTSVFKILTNRESRSGTVGRVLLGLQCFLNQAGRGGTVGQDFVLLFCFSDFLPNQTSSGPCDLLDSVGRESAESFMRILAIFFPSLF